MIGWRIGWIVGPATVMGDVRLASLSNVVCQVGIAMPGAAAALTAADDGVAAAVTEWEKRRDVLVAQLADLPVVRPHGGWSLLIDTDALGIEPGEASQRLLAHGKIAATPMTNWGPGAERYLRFVFSNEPASRLGDVRERIRASWNL